MIQYLIIKPTTEKGDDGWHLGECQLIEKESHTAESNVIDTWKCDCFRTIGDVHADFEGDGGIRFWSDNGAEMEIVKGECTYIRGKHWERTYGLNEAN